MAKLPITITAQSNVTTEESNLITSHSDTQPKVAGKKRNFEVTDPHALYAVYPQFFKLVPDFAKIRQAIRLGIPMTGVVIHGKDEKQQPTIDSGEDDESIIEDNSGQPLQRL